MNMEPLGSACVVSMATMVLGRLARSVPALNFAV
jgi:hypothetical protein